MNDYRELEATSILDTNLGKWWINQMILAGITPKHAPAHLHRNCKKFARMKGKDQAYEQAKKFALSGNLVKDFKPKSSIILLGSVGTGKTWLATAIFKHLLWIRTAASARELRFVWTTFGGMIRHIQSTYSNKDLDTEIVLSVYRNCSCLLIDDFGDMDSGEASNDKRSLVYEIIDSRNSNGRTTILTSNLEPGEMQNKWGERVFDRVAEMARFVSMKGENMRRKKIEQSDNDRMIQEVMEVELGVNENMRRVHKFYPLDSWELN